MPVLSDAQLIRGLAVPLPALRRRFARRAAARGVHAAALAAEPDDPAVLALAGLYPAALAARAADRTGRQAQAVAAAAVGAPDAIPSAGHLPDAWRHRLARGLAPLDPHSAAALLTDRPVEQAACLVAADRPAEAEAILARAERSPERSLVAAAVAAHRGSLRACRAAIRDLFDVFGLRSPLDPGEAPFNLDTFAADAQPIAAGPLVSVVVPLHDGAATIETALRSLQAQSWRNLEIIVCDDRSGDEGPALVAAMAGGDPRIRLISSREEPGASGARNSAIAEAQGAFVAFLDADDWAHPARIARQMDMLRPAAAATVSRHFRIDDRGTPVAPRVTPMIRLCPISLLLRRAVLADIGGFEPSRAGADAELLGRIETIYGRSAAPRDPAPLTVARWRAASISNDPERGLFDPERLVYRERWMRAHARLYAAGGLPRHVPAP